MYLNWKTDRELPPENKVLMEVVPDELELFQFNRDVVVVDSYATLQAAILSLSTKRDF